MAEPPCDATLPRCPTCGHYLAAVEGLQIGAEDLHAQIAVLRRALETLRMESALMADGWSSDESRLRLDAAVDTAGRVLEAVRDD